MQRRRQGQLDSPSWGAHAFTVHPKWAKEKGTKLHCSVHREHASSSTGKCFFGFAISCVWCQWLKVSDTHSSCSWTGESVSRDFPERSPLTTEKEVKTGQQCKKQKITRKQKRVNPFQMEQCHKFFAQAKWKHQLQKVWQQLWLFLCNFSPCPNFACTLFAFVLPFCLHTIKHQWLWLFCAISQLFALLPFACFASIF